MADEEKKESKVPPEPGAEPAPGGSIVGKLLGIVLPAVFAGAAAFLGAKLGQPAAGAHEEHAKKIELPGLTIDLKAFVVNVIDEKTGEGKPCKMTVAIELKKLAKKEEFEPFVPRIRDQVLSYVRSLSYQEVTNPRTKERMTEDLLSLIHKLGAEQAERVLIQELVTQ